MTEARIAILALALLGGCKASESKPAKQADAPTPVAKPVAAPAATLPPPKLSATGTEKVQWLVGGHRFDVGVVTTEKKGPDGVTEMHAVLRFTDGGTAHEIEVDANDDITLRVVYGGVLLRSQTLVARVQEVGGLFANQAMFVKWDLARDKPIVGNTWSCDETETKDARCSVPTWAEQE